jgi:hypothetical protein
MRQLKIDLSELELAFESGNNMLSFYLDLETGEIVSVSAGSNSKTIDYTNTSWLGWRSKGSS